MEKKALKALTEAGYQEDRETLRAFEQGYRWITVPAVTLFFIGLFIWMGWQDPVLGLGLAIPGLLAVAGSILHTSRSRPRSLRSGREMTAFQREDGLDGQVEYLYVDEGSRTYFRRVLLARD